MYSSEMFVLAVTDASILFHLLVASILMVGTIVIFEDLVYRTIVATRV